MKYILFICILALPATTIAQERTIMPDSTGVEQFIDILRQRQQIKDSRERNFLSVLEWHGKGKWVKEEDIGYLLKLIHSGQKCPCIASAFSSTLPPKNEYATVGGIAIDLLDYYYAGDKFPGMTVVKHGKFENPVWYRCPKTDKERIKEIEARATKYQR